MAMRLLPSLDTSVFARFPATEVEDRLRTQQRAWIFDYADEVNTRQLDLLFAYRSTGHFGSHTGASWPLIGSEMPFYVRDVFTAAFSTNFRHRNVFRLMQRMIASLDPAVA